MSAVPFDFATWTARYPEFASVSPTTAALFWAEAGIYCQNDDGSIIPESSRSLILYAITSQVAWLQGLGTGNTPNPQIVGRVSDAAQGSVNVSVDAGEDVKGSKAWFYQTRYGASAWRMMGPWRKGLYVAPPCQAPFVRVV